MIKINDLRIDKNEIRIDKNRDDIKYNNAQIEKIKLEIKEGISYNWENIILNIIIKKLIKIIKNNSKKK